MNQERPSASLSQQALDSIALITRHAQFFAALQQYDVPTLKPWLHFTNPAKVDDRRTVNADEFARVEFLRQCREAQPAWPCRRCTQRCVGKHDLATAEDDAEMAVSLVAPSQGSQIQSTATPEQKMTALIDLSLVRCARGACAGAIPDLRRALQLANANYTPNSVPVGLLDFLLGYANWKSGDNRAAVQQMKIGTSELASQLSWGHPTYIAVLKQYRTFLTETGEPAEASELEAKIAALETSRATAHSGLAHASFGFDQLP